MKFNTIEEHIRAINSNPTARLTLDLMSFAAVECLAPRGRAAATGATLKEIADLPDMEELTLHVADLVVGLSVIWSHYAAYLSADMRPCDIDKMLGVERPASVTVWKWENERDAKAKARATTIREIGEHLSQYRGVYASEAWNVSRQRCAKVWALAAESFPGDDPRAKAIRETWAREARFLAD